MIYDSLLEWDPKLNIRNAIAESYDVVNPKRIDWTIKKGLKYSNGQEVTAADVKYSFDLQANPPLPGSVASTTQFPGIESTQVLSKYKLRMNLKTPDARIYGYLAWARYSSVVPDGMYQMLDPAVDGIGTGPFKLDGKYVPNSGLTVVRNPNFWKKGLPYLDSIQYRVITDEQSRVAALRAGAIHGATVSADSAAALSGANGLTVLHGLNASFRELQFTIKQGETKPWHDKRVRQAVSFAINRQNIIDKVYGGFGQYSGHVAAGYGPWPLSQDELKTKYEKYDVPKAKALMKEAGQLGLRRDDDDVRDAGRLRRHVGARSSPTSRRSGSTSTSSRRTRPPSPRGTGRASSTGISPAAGCAVTRTATRTSTTRPRRSTRRGSPATRGTRRCSG